MTCVLLMIECIYGHDGMDGGIPNEVTLHRCLLSNIPFMPVERQQHLSLFMKNYQSPFENIFIFLFFPPCSLQRLCALCCFPVAADVLSPFRTQTKTCDNVIHIHLICSEFRQSFPAFNISATRRWVFSSPLMLCQYPPLYQATHH